MTKTRKPSLPAVRTSDIALKQVLDGLREQAMRWRGDVGPIEDRVVTIGDLVDGNIARLRPGATRRSDGTIIESREGTTETRVGALSNLQASGVFEMVILTWDGTNQSNYSLTEVWRATVDDLGQAVFRGTAIPGVFQDQADQDQTYYYWIRAVSTSGQPGPYNDSDGVKAQTSASPDAVRDAITSTKWQAETAYRPFAVIRPTSQEITIQGVPVSFQASSGGTTGSSEPDWSAEVSALGDTVSDGTVTWQAVDAGKAPLVIGTRNGNPVVVMPGVVIEEASIVSAKIKDLAVESAKIADAAIVEAKIADAEISTAKIRLAAITNALIANAAITTAKIGDAEITSAKIGNAEIKNAKIANAAVDTLKIDGNAVTLPVTSYTGGFTSFGTSWKKVQTATINSSGQPISIHMAATVRAAWVISTSDPTNTVQCYVARDGNQLISSHDVVTRYTEQGVQKETWAYSLGDTPGGGSHTYELWMRDTEDHESNVGRRSITLLETKR